MRVRACADGAAGGARREERVPGRAREPDDARTAERRTIVALLVAATILYAGVIPGEIVWKAAAKRGSGASEKNIARLTRR